MSNSQELSLSIRKYLQKLQYIIKREHLFTLFEIKIIDKNKIDDILCCIEGSFPSKYKEFAKIKKLESYSYYKKLLEAIKNRFLLSTTVYSVQYNDAISLIDKIHNTIEADLQLLNND